MVALSHVIISSNISRAVKIYIMNGISITLNCLEADDRLVNIL